MPNTLTKRGGPRAVAAAARPAPARADEGVVVGIVAVTGTEDSVQDVIVPGAFTDTLRKRRPKLAWMHDWKLPLGRVLSIVELRPGDKRLPTVLPDGRRWPKEAGALIATMQFNLRTQQGREFFEHAKEWAKNGEAAFSIGYVVSPGMATKRADGVRMIYQLDLFEVSLVLHGAHNMALALEVKDALGAAPGMEHKDVGGLLEVKGQPDFSGHAMIALYPPREAAEKVCHPDGHPADDMHVTLAYLGKASDIKDPAALAKHLGAITSQNGALSGTVGGLGIFPAGDNGTPVYANVDVPGLETLRHNVVTGLDDFGQDYSRSHGYTPHMTLGYDLPSVSPLAPVPVAFDQAVLKIGDQRYPLPLTAPRMEGKSAVMEARALLASPEIKAAAAAVVEAKTYPTHQETKNMSIRGSYEQRKAMLNDALESLLTPRNDDGERSEYVCVDATFDDHVVCTVTDFGHSVGQSYKVPYTVDADSDAVQLGKPAKVELNVVVEEEGAPAGPAEAGEAVRLRFIDPATASMADATKYVLSTPEGKGLDGITAPLLELLDALAVKGYDVARAVMGAVDDPMWEEDDAMPVEHDRFRGQRKGMDVEEHVAPAPDEDEDDELSTAEAAAPAPDADPEAPAAAPAPAGDVTVDAPAAGDVPEAPADVPTGDPADTPADVPADAPAPEDDLEEDDEQIDPDSDQVTLDPEAVRAQMDALRA